MPFMGINGLRGADDVVEMTPHMLAEIKKCKKDPVYFAQNYIYINTKDYGMQLFDTRDYQEEMINKFNLHRYNIALMARQTGKCVKKCAKITARIEKKSIDFIGLTESVKSDVVLKAQEIIKNSLIKSDNENDNYIYLYIEIERFHELTKYIKLINSMSTMQ